MFTPLLSVAQSTFDGTLGALRCLSYTATLVRPRWQAYLNAHLAGFYRQLVNNPLCNVHPRRLQRSLALARFYLPHQPPVPLSWLGATTLPR